MPVQATDETNKAAELHHLCTESEIDPDFEPHISGEHHLTTQSDLDDLVMDL
ncbi:hypothetical protein CHS0354_025673, partial [Potamilus streckersoni]